MLETLFGTHADSAASILFVLFCAFMLVMVFIAPIERLGFRPTPRVKIGIRILMLIVWAVFMSHIHYKFVLAQPAPSWLMALEAGLFLLVFSIWAVASSVYGGSKGQDREQRE